MDLDPLKVDTNFFKENPVEDSSRILSYVQITKRVDKTVLTVDYEARTSKRITIGDIGKVLMTQMSILDDEVLGIIKYYFGQEKGYLKIKMARPIDVKARFRNNGGKAQDEVVAITIRGCEPTNEKLRLLNINELATTNEVLTKLQSEGLSVMNVYHERCSMEVPLFANKNNGNMIAFIKRCENTDLMKNININGVSVPVIWCDRKKRGCFRCGKLGHNRNMCDKEQVADSESQMIKPQQGAFPNLHAQEETVRTQNASSNSAAMMDSENPGHSDQNEDDDSVMESSRIEMEINTKPTGFLKDDTGVIDEPLGNDGTVRAPNSFASLDDPVEYPCLGSLNQSKVVDRPARKLKRATSISPSHGSSMKKLNSRRSPPQSKEV